MMKDVTIYSRDETATGEKFRAALCKKFPKYRFTRLDNAGSVSTVALLLVIVHNYSRIGTDIDSVIRDLSDLDCTKVAIVVFHVQAKHAQPSLMPTKTLTDERYLQYGCLVDFFYTPEDMIYSSSLNDKAEEELKSFLESLVKKDKGSPKRKNKQGHKVSPEQSAEKKAKKLQVYAHSETRTSEEFRHKLCTKTIKKYHSVQVEDADQISTNHPLLVTVQNHSRIGTDIDDALRDLPDLDCQKVVIVVFHVKGVHALPESMPTQNLTDEKYSKYGCMVDFFYTPEDKIYSCNLNDEAEKNLNTFLKAKMNMKMCTINGKPEVDLYEDMKKDVTIYSRDETATGAEFRKTLCKNIKKYRKYRFTLVENAGSVSSDAPLLVIVHNHSRIGTDIDSVLRGLPDLDCRKAAIVVFHVQAKHSLPQLMPTKTLVDERYSQYDCLVDFFYTPDDKIYSCSLNDKAKRDLKLFLKRQFKKDQGSPKKSTDNKVRPEHIAGKKEKKLHVYASAETKTCDEFRDRLCHKTINQYKSKQVGKEVLEDVVQEYPDRPLLVIVHNHSRIGTDIDTALRDVPDLDCKKMVIVVLHVLAKHALPQLMPTKNLTDKKYSKYGCMVDFFYTPDDKIYSCKLNADAKKQLKSFLKSPIVYARTSEWVDGQVCVAQIYTEENGAMIVNTEPSCKSACIRNFKQCRPRSDGS